MSTAKQYRAKAAEYTETLKAASLPAETREFRGSNKATSRWPKMKNGWQRTSKKQAVRVQRKMVGDAVFTQQGKHTPGCHRTDVATQSTAIPAEIQQLFDDAGSTGGLLQTATLRGQIGRFLHKHKGHKDDDFS